MWSFCGSIRLVCRQQLRNGHRRGIWTHAHIQRPECTFFFAFPLLFFPGHLLRFNPVRNLRKYKWAMENICSGILWSKIEDFLRFSLACLTESCFFGHGLKVFSPCLSWVSKSTSLACIFCFPANDGRKEYTPRSFHKSCVHAHLNKTKGHSTVICLCGEDTSETQNRSSVNYWEKKYNFYICFT